jgi:gluconolactonase
MTYHQAFEPAFAHLIIPVCGLETLFTGTRWAEGPVYFANGLAFSADERTLFVADSGRSHGADRPHHVRTFAVDEAGVLSAGRVFANIEPGVPDGLRLDEAGNLWVAAGDGVHCYDPGGTLLGKILIAEPVANLCFGGPRRNRLFITAASTLYAVFLNTRGIQRP